MSLTTEGTISPKLSESTVHPLFDVEHPANHVLSAITGTIGAIGFPGNVFLICLMVKNIKKSKPHDWLLLNLACIDLMLCLNNVAMEAPFIVNFRNVGCEIAGFTDYFFGMLSFTVPPTVAFNRYLSLYNQNLYKRLFTRNKVAMMCFGPWILSFALFAPYLITGNIGLDDLGLCGTKLATLGLQVLFAFVVCPLIFTFYAISFVCGYKVMRKIRDHKFGLVTNVQTRVVEESKELITLLSLLLVIPIVAQMPGVFTKLVQTFVPIDPWITRFLIAPFPLTSACNAYLTILTVKTYKTMTKNIFCFGTMNVHPTMFTASQSRQQGSTCYLS